MISVNITYQVISPESASNGDFHEQGFQAEDLQFNDRIEALEYFNDKYGYYQDNGNDSYSTSDPDTDLHTGHETYYSIHFDTTPRPTLKLV